jgi:ketosteroid isomerase-like protein
MHSLIRPAVALAAAFMASIAGATPVPTAAVAEAQLRAINHRFVNAFLVEDGDFMNALTAEDFLLTDHVGSWIGRDEYLGLMRQPMPFEGASYRDAEVRLFGPVALLHGVFEGVLPAGKLSRVRYTDVYVWDGAAWRLVSAQNTPVKEGSSLAKRLGTAPAHAPWSGEDPTGDDLEVLRRLNEGYVRAFRESDVAWYDAHLAPDYIAIVGDGGYQDREATLAAFAEPTFATHMKSFPVDQVTIRRFADVALIHAENAYELKDGKRGVSRYTDIWYKRDGRWRCVAAHITVHKAPG